LLKEAFFVKFNTIQDYKHEEVWIKAKETANRCCRDEETKKRVADGKKNAEEEKKRLEKQIRAITNDQ